MMHIRYKNECTSYGSLSYGETFTYDNELYMVIDFTDPGTEDRTFASVNVAEGKVTYKFANGTMVRKVDCDILVKEVGC